MMDTILSQIARGAGFCVLLCLCGPAAAEYPEMGGPKQFDLFCQGQVTRVQDFYIPTPGARPVGKDALKTYKVSKHLIVDLNSMQFLGTNEGGGDPEFRKIAREKDGLLYLYDDRGFNRWVINLYSYKSVAVSEDDDGSIYIERAQCRPAKFSGFAGAPGGPPMPAIIRK